MNNPHPIPSRYLEPSACEMLTTLDPRLIALAAALTSPAGFLVLGPTGVGKTLAAACGAERLAKLKGRNTWAQWIRADALSRILSTKGAAEDIDRLKAARFLVIDELGYERFPELCLEVIGDRHDFNRPTLVTSGLERDVFADRYGDATIRRIVEVGGGAVINCWKPVTSESLNILNSRAKSAPSEVQSAPAQPSANVIHISARELPKIGKKVTRVELSNEEIAQRRRDAKAALAKLESEVENAATTS